MPTGSAHVLSGDSAIAIAEREQLDALARAPEVPDPAPVLTVHDIPAAIAVQLSDEEKEDYVFAMNVRRNQGRNRAPLR